MAVIYLCTKCGFRGKEHELVNSNCPRCDSKVAVEGSPEGKKVAEARAKAGTKA
jgi:DNA-directed RNA polymerase subunit RPC12/RpoP